MARFRKRPVVINAIQWTGDNLDQLRSFVPEEFRHNKIHEPMGIVTLEGVMTVSEGDWIIKGIHGEFYPCKPDVFEATYEALSDAARTKPLPEVEALFKALSRSRGQWIHSVNKDQCLEALEAYRKSRGE